MPFAPIGGNKKIRQILAYGHLNHDKVKQGLSGPKVGASAFSGKDRQTDIQTDILKFSK